MCGYRERLVTYSHRCSDTMDCDMALITAKELSLAMSYQSPSYSTRQINRLVQSGIIQSVQLGKKRFIIAKGMSYQSPSTYYYIYIYNNKILIKRSIIKSLVINVNNKSRMSGQLPSKKIDVDDDVKEMTKRFIESLPLKNKPHNKLKEYGEVFQVLVGKYGLADVKRLLEWIRGSWWRDKILSPKKLQKSNGDGVKYYDVLWAQMDMGGKSGNGLITEGGIDGYADL